MGCYALLVMPGYVLVDVELCCVSLNTQLT